MPNSVGFLGRSSLKILIATFLILSGIQAHAQSLSTDNLKGMLNVHSGYNLPEYPFISSITEDYIRSIEICLLKETVGKNKWEQIYNYPSYGLSLFYSTLGNEEVFGREIALTYFFRLYFISKDRFRLFNRTGFGISYVNRKFDFQDNYLNVAVGSNVNIHFNFRIGADYILSDKFSLNAGLSFDHFSNANTSEPNLGINYLTGYGGLSYSIGKKSKKQIHEIEAYTKETTYVLFASIGGKHSRALSSKYFFTSSVSFELKRALSQKFQLGIGADMFYDSSVKSSLEKNSRDYKSSDSFQTGVHLTQSVVYNKFSLSLQEGIYLLLTEQVDDYLIYSRFMVQYQISKKFLLRLAMKSHLHILDFPEIGFGYKI